MFNGGIDVGQCHCGRLLPGFIVGGYTLEKR